MKPPMNLLLVVAVLEASADSFQTRTVHPGQNVTLSGPDCSANASVTLERHGSDKYVVDIYSCIDGHAIRPEHQDPSFVGRVEETECPLKSGIVSVTLKNVTLDDAGEYEWFCKNNTGNSSLKVRLKVTDGGAADGGNTSGNTTSGNTTSGIPPDVGAIVGGTTGGTFAVVLIVVILILYFCRNRLKRCRIPCRLGDQQNSELQPVTYKEVKQQQD